MSSLLEKASGLDFTLTSTLIDGNTEIRITKQPEHGSTEITPAMNFPTYPKESARFKCNEHKVRGWQLNYKSAEKYSGKDEFDLLILFPSGFAWEHHYDMTVR